MGLDTTHDAWHGAYGAFMRWRQAIAAAAGLPPLELMENFFEKGSYSDPFVDMAKHFPSLANAYYESLPIRWDCLKPDPIFELLHHSDCEGEIPASSCSAIADSLERLLPQLEARPDQGGHIGNWGDKTRKFIAGLRAAAEAKEPLGFH